MGPCKVSTGDLTVRRPPSNFFRPFHPDLSYSADVRDLPRSNYEPRHVALAKPGKLSIGGYLKQRSTTGKTSSRPGTGSSGPTTGWPPRFRSRSSLTSLRPRGTTTDTRPGKANHKPGKPGKGQSKQDSD